VTITATQAALVAALAAARGGSLRTVEVTMGVKPGSLCRALARGALPRAALAARARLTAEAVADALGVPVGALLGEPVSLAAAE
jgi:lambda repressor-like predicted transcriptional regulator